MANYLIIAGTSSIGTSVVEKLLASEHGVFVTGRNLKKIELMGQRYNIPFTQLDASDFGAVNSAFELAINKMGGLYGVVNCAGSLLLKPAHSTNFDEYEKVITANLTTSFAVVSAAGKYLTKEDGSVVLISSAAAMVGIANHEAIAAAKAGIIGLTLAAAATYASSRLQFNAVAPGLVETSLTALLTASPASRKISEAMHPLGSLGKPQDVAAAINFFLDPENNWITGQVLAVDGGLSSVRPKIIKM